VIVEFLDGDPDRPLVTGCVYNGKYPPPYNPADEGTRMTIRSSSTCGSGGFNEIRMDDNNGFEEFFLHAQKNMNVVVQNNHSTDVKVNQAIKIGGDQTTNITNNQEFK